MKRSKSTSKNLWETTDTACLLRHKNSRKYYGRFTLRGKQKWVNLDTNVLTVAKLRLPDEVKKMEKLRTLEPNVNGGHATVGELMETFLARGRDMSRNALLHPDRMASCLEAGWWGAKLLAKRRLPFRFRA